MPIDSIVERVHRLVLDNLPARHSKTPSGWVTFNCPVCNEKRKRGGVIVTGAKIAFHCFNCGAKAAWTPYPGISKRYKELAEKLGCSLSELNKVQLDLLRYSEELDQADLHTEYNINFHKFKTVDLPGEATNIEDLPDGHDIKEYARNRGILGLYPLFHIDSTLYRKRVTMPFLFDNDIVGWSGRHINPPNSITPKYLQSIQPGYVFNIDRFTGGDRKIVVVCEGLIDAILLDGVSVMGNSVTPEQAHLIDKLGIRVVLCPDRDRPGKQLIEQAVELGWDVSFPPWSHDCKDASDAVSKYGRLLTLSSIMEHATNNKIKIQVKTKML
jgi:hypothetical protein